MTDLIKYKGNFLDFADREFEESESCFASDRGDGIMEIDLLVACNVGIFPAKGTTTIVEVIDAKEPSDFTIERQGSILTIEQVCAEKSNGNVVMNIGNIDGIKISGASYIGDININGVNYSGGNISIVNGSVYRDGMPIEELRADRPSTKPPKTPKIRIYTNKGMNLTATLKGNSILASKISLGKSNLTIADCATIGIATESLKLKVKGRGNSYAVIQGGRLRASISGQGEVRAKGHFGEVDASVSGMGSIATEGTCHGDYEASVSGMGSIRHAGTILGRSRKSVSGMGSIQI